MILSAQYEGFLSFIEKINSVAAYNAKLMEDLMFTDPSSAIVKARLFAEEILNEVFKLEEINEPYITSLFERISYLAKYGIIKKDIQQSFDTIRLAGNKAAHDGTFNDIATAYKLHKEMYKLGVWFYEVYYSGQLMVPQYEMPKPKENESMDDIKDIVRDQIMRLLGTDKLKGQEFLLSGEKQKSEVEVKDDNDNVKSNEESPVLNKDIEKGRSYLVRELTRLKDSSQEAIENANQFSAFKKYLHIDRKIQLDLEKILNSNREGNKNSLILLCGSVGDGKSHLLAYIKEEKPQLINDYTIFNDATESFSPNKNAMETLEEVLKGFSDEEIHESNDKVILAINMGVLHNFVNRSHEKYSYSILKDFVEQSGLFTQNITTTYSDNYFDLLSFGDYHSYELTEEGARSNFYSSLLSKIVEESDRNPFYLALKEDEKNNHITIVHENFRFLQDEFVREQIVELIIQTIVRKKLVISARAFMNFIADILIPGDVENLKLANEFEVLESSLPYLIFNRSERSEILHAMADLDPIHERSKYIDQIIVDLNTLNDREKIINDYELSHTAPNWLIPFLKKNGLADHSLNVFIESFIRIVFLTNPKFANNIADNSMKTYLENVYAFNIGDKKKIKEFYDEIKSSVYKWQGNLKKDYIYMNKPVDEYRIAQKLNIKPSIAHLPSSTETILDSFKSTIVLAYDDEVRKNKIYLDIDFPLYDLLTKVQEGYRPNKNDEEDAIKFIEFIDRLMAIGEKKNEILIHFPHDNKNYLLKRDDFGAFVFEREY
ncbi:DNA phosphorothioation-dependent restriction protein DptF [Bacillus sp. FJAT-49754]|nr:DNA phosphorothioation-dependent restriction protein DptF [Lederbergia citrea]